jgi:GT2 family glycosyltransferase
MDPEVTVITLNWNGWQDTLECLASLYHIDYDDYRVILVDNASTDDSLAKIEAYCTKELNLRSCFTEGSVRSKPIKIVHYTTADAEEAADSGAGAQRTERALTVIQNEQNYGYAEGNNIGVAYALNAFDPDYVLLLNNDTVVDRHFLRALVNAAENDEHMGLLQPKMLRYADAMIDNTGNVCDRLAYCEPRGLGEVDVGQYDQDRKNEFFYATGACVLIRKTVLSAFSGECFDPHLFAYYEDVDLSWMARLLGFKVGYSPDSVCYHKGSATFGSFDPFISYLSERNRLRVLIKNYALRTLFFVLPLTVVLKSAVLPAQCALSLDLGYLTSFVKALAWNIHQLRTTLSMRKSLQSQRKVSDNEIMRYMISFSFKPRAKRLQQWRRRRS